MLVNCVECGKDVSDTVTACPHCGYALKPDVASASQGQQSKRTAIFQYISLSAAFVALFTPRILVSLPCLVVISAGVIALVRREPRWALSLSSIVIAFLIIGSSPSSIGSDPSYIEKMQIQGWEYTTERNFVYVRGRVKNVGDKTVSYFKITAYYRDAAGNVLDTDYTNSGENLHPGMAKEFEIMHRVLREYETATVAIEEVRTE